ncbi:SurA N-terminal domain-containing protein [Georgenia sunbinii]|uniref:SurA N-terminal domain-containing protein n=1 Tax=Georgenia sunbinii TaxID=3117728 RepID=UPI002F26473F
MRTTTRLAAAAAVALLALGGCATDDDEPTDDATTTEAPDAEAPEGEAPEGEAPEMPEPDLEGLPEVIADVNGVEISRDEFVTTYEGQFQQLVMQAQMSGEELDQDTLKADTADVLVDTQLLIQEAEARDFAASDEDVDATLTELAEANGMATGDEFLAALEAQGMTADTVMAQLTEQVKIDQLYTDEGGDYTPNEDEVRALYDEAIAQQPPAAEGQEAPEPPAFDEVRPQLEEQLTQQHQGEVIGELLTQLRESAEINIHL